jgi:hypothetical protein
MDISEQSVAFIETQMEENFSQIMKDYIIKEMYWNDNDPNNIRAIAEMFCAESVKDESLQSLNNLYVLFPPFSPEDN